MPSYDLPAADRAMDEIQARIARMDELRSRMGLFHRRTDSIAAIDDVMTAFAHVSERMTETVKALGGLSDDGRILPEHVEIEEAVEARRDRCVELHDRMSEILDQIASMLDEQERLMWAGTDATLH